MKMRTLTVLIAGFFATCTVIACGGETDTGDKSIDVTGAGGTDAATATGGNSAQETGGSGAVATGGTVAAGGTVASGGTTESGGVGGMSTGGSATTGGTGGAADGSSGNEGATGGSGGVDGGAGGIVNDGGPQFRCDPMLDPYLYCDDCAQLKCCPEWENCVNDPSGACLSSDMNGGSMGDMTCVIACTDYVFNSTGAVTELDVQACAANCGHGGGPVGVEAEALIACLMAMPAGSGGERNCGIQCFSAF